MRRATRRTDGSAGLCRRFWYPSHSGFRNTGYSQYSVPRCRRGPKYRLPPESLRPADDAKDHEGLCLRRFPSAVEVDLKYADRRLRLVQAHAHIPTPALTGASAGSVEKWP